MKQFLTFENIVYIHWKRWGSINYPRIDQKNGRGMNGDSSFKTTSSKEKGDRKAGISPILKNGKAKVMAQVQSGSPWASVK